MAGAGTTKRYIFGVRIFLQDVASQDTTIGLYTTSFGDATSQYDVTNPTGTTMRVTWDGTGTDPNFDANEMVIGDKVVTAGFAQAGNNGTFTVLKVTDDYFEVDNSAVVAENNTTSVTITSAYRFRWIQTASANTTDTWKAGLINKNGIGRIGQGADFSRGGNIAQWKGTSTTVTNAISTTVQMWKKIEDAGISLNGLRAEVVEFDTDTAHGGTRANEMVLNRGITELPSGWTKTRYTTPSKSAYYKRRSNLATLIDNDPVNGNYPNADDKEVGKAVPLTFGEHDKAIFIRTARSVSQFDADGDQDFNNDITGTFSGDATKYFPVVGDDGETDSLIYKLRMDETVIWAQSGSPVTSGTLNLTWFAGKYIKVVQGDGVGEYRLIASANVDLDTSLLTDNAISGQKIVKVTDGTKFAVNQLVIIVNGNFSETNAIDSISVNTLTMKTNLVNTYTTAAGAYVAGDINTINFTITDYFSTQLAGNITATIGTNQTWVAIETIERSYKSDVWPCNAYLDFDGAAVTQGLELYTYDSERTVSVSGSEETVPLRETEKNFRRIPAYAYEDSGSGNNNQVDVDVKMFDSDPDDVSAVLIKAMPSVTLVSDADLDNWSEASFVRNFADGLFTAVGTAADVTLTLSAGAIGNVIDGNSSTSVTYTIANTSTLGQVFFAMKFGAPAYPDDFEFDSVYIGLKLAEVGTTDTPIFRPKWRRFIGGATNIFDKTFNAALNPLIDDMPDFYFSDGPSTNNKNFYIEKDVVQEGTDELLTGYTLFEISGIDSKDKYESISEFALLYRLTLGGVSKTTALTITEAAIIFKKSSSIKESIFSGFQGRLINSTWGGRRSHRQGDSTTVVNISAAGGVIAISYVSGKTFSTTPVNIGEYLVTNSTTFNAGNNGTFRITGKGANSFALADPDGVGSTQLGVQLSDDDSITVASMIENPIDALEHVLRLQNWHEVGSTAEVGLEYAANAQINTGLSFGDDTSQYDVTNPTGTTMRVTWDGTGLDPNFASNGLVVDDKVATAGFVNPENDGIFTVTAVTDSYFEVTNSDVVAESNTTSVSVTSANEGELDYLGLDDVKNLTVARQITDYESAWSDSMIKSLCQQFFLASWQDNNGQENVSIVGKLKTTPTETLNLANIIRGSIGEVTETSSKDVFVQPFIQYNFNHATGKFNNIIRITDVEASTFNAAYVTGYYGTEAERIWNMAHALWEHYRVIEEPPTDITDLTWVNQESVAEQYIFTLLNWFGAFEAADASDEITVAPKRRVPFSIPYDVATTINGVHRPWHVGFHFLLALPHETNAVSVQCMVEDISFDIGTGLVKLGVIMFGVTDEIAFYIKDSFRRYADHGWADWKDSYLTKAEAPSQSYDIRDAT